MQIIIRSGRTLAYRPVHNVFCAMGVILKDKLGVLDRQLKLVNSRNKIPLKNSNRFTSVSCTNNTLIWHTTLDYLLETFRDFTDFLEPVLQFLCEC